MNPTEQARNWLAAFDAALSRNDVDAVCAMFGDECYWRDMVAFTWNIVTSEGREAIAAMLRANLAAVTPSAWSIEGEASVADDVVQAWFTFETGVARGKGHLRLKGGKAYTLLTTMQELKGFEEHRRERRDEGVQLGAIKGRRSWLERKQQEEAELGITRQPFCLVVGGGQGGIGLGARLKQLGVPTLIVDRHERPGDAWRKRYKSLCLHDTVWFDHMPYLPFPEHWPVYSPKDKIGDWLEMYTKIMELNYWSSTTCKGAQYDAAAQEWVVDVVRDGQALTLRPRHLILATGMSGMPSVPRIPGAETFAGTQHHSSRHPGGEGFAGRRCVVVGSNNSAHDICADLWEHDAAEITMVQRSSTLVVRTETQRRMSRNGLYSEAAVKNGITADIADLTNASIPYRVLPRTQMAMWQQIQQDDAPFYDALRKVGFMLDFGDDGSGLGMKYFSRGSGYYIDVGGSELIANGSVKLKSAVDVVGISPQAVHLSDGTEIACDLIVYATGYGSMNGWAAELISQEVADRVGKCWGFGSGRTKDPGPWEGELRNMWKPAHQPALWFHGGNLAQSRFYSLFLALQLKARLEGIPTPVWGMPPVHHLG